MHNGDDERSPLLASRSQDSGDSSGDSEEEDEGGKTGDVSVSQLAVMFTCLGALVILGVTAGMVLEQWHFITALYVVVQLMTTIGYGDFSLSSNAMKLLFSFIGCCTIVIYICIANHVRGDFHKDFLRHQLEKVEAAYVRRSTTLQGPVPAMSVRSMDQFHHKVTKAFRRYNKLIIATVPALLDITFGTLFYGNYEACTCSYGSSRVPGCNEDSYEACVKSGGYTKTFLSAFYMSVMTVLTVGFGDVSPRSKVGRAVGVVWMLTGVASMANWLKELSNFIYSCLHVQHDEHETDASQMDKMARMMDARNAFLEMDTDGDGQLTRTEFRMYFLLRQKLVSREALTAIDRFFDELDRDHSDFVTVEEAEYAHVMREEAGLARSSASKRDAARSDSAPV